jgi:hypothetical protein
MINANLFWMFLGPIACAVALFFLLPRFFTGRDSVKKALICSAIGLVLGCSVLTGAFYLGKGAKTHDTEIWNGEVTSKARTHGEYTESYQCNCRTVTSGSGKNQTTSTVCDTCYREHYTVSWDCSSNIGGFHIDGADWLNQAVYLLPDPGRYTVIQKGDPVSKNHWYTNYIKAVPETLFRPASDSLKQQFAGQIPAYPISIYDLYHVDRVIPVGVNMPNVHEWNVKLSEALKTLGPAKQANAVIVVTKSVDPNYFYALQDAWLNGKKNDIIIVIGAPEFPGKAAWVNIMALTDQDIFKIKLRDDILALDSLTADSVIGALTKNTNETFKRKRMRDFAYLDAEIDPPMWLMVLAEGLVFAGFGGFLFFCSKQSSRSSYRGYRRY